MFNVVRKVRKELLVTTLGAAVALLSTLPAHAISFSESGGQPPDGENVMIGMNQSGTTVFGSTQQSNLSLVFNSTEDLFTPSGGQAKISAADGILNNLSIEILNGFYTGIIFNPLNGVEVNGSYGPANVTVDYLNLATSATQSHTYTLGNGNNFLTILADQNEVIKKTTINTGFGFLEFQQPRIGGAALDSTIEVSPNPEPGSLALLATGGLPLLGILRRRSRKKTSG
jgi:hypothetical protein